MVQTDEGDLNDDIQNSFLQFAGDNVDHSLATLDGKGTFHGMGIILMRTPLDVKESGKCGQDKPIRRLQRNTVSQVVAGHSIPVVQYTAAEVSALSTLTFTDYSLLSHFTAVSESNRVMNYDLLWHVGSMFSDIQQRRPGWLGFMQSVHDSPDYPVVADIRMLPMIDRNPTDMSTIYSASRASADSARAPAILAFVASCILFIFLSA